MRFLALATSDDGWFASLDPVEGRALARAEARRAWELHVADVIRSMHWRTDRRDVVIELEAADEAAAREALASLPFVGLGAVRFELIGLRPYDAWGLVGGVDPLLVERALAWALARLGDPGYALRCLAFVEDAYEAPNGIEVFGGDCARASAEAYAAAGEPDDAPRGSFVFFDTAGVVDGSTRDWGHVGLALGDGRIVHAWPDVRLDPIEAVAGLPAGAWSPPRYRGWAAPEVILAGSRPRARPTGGSSSSSSTT